MKHYSIFFILFLFLLSCANGSSNSTSYPYIEINNGICDTDSDGVLSNCRLGLSPSYLGEVSQSSITIKNSGERDLILKSIKLEDTSGKYSLVLPGEYNMFGTYSVGGDLEDYLTIYILYTNTDNKFNDTAKLTIISDAENSPYISINVYTNTPNPSISIVPAFINFDMVDIDEVKSEPVNIYNTGSSDLVISSFSWAGDIQFKLNIQDKIYVHSSNEITLIEPLIVLPGEYESVTILFEPTSYDPAGASLYLYSNDYTDGSNKSLVSVVGNSAIPIIVVNPESINFGGKLIGEKAIASIEIKNVGEKELIISNILFAQSSSPDFNIELMDQQFPISIITDDIKMVNISFVPDVINTKNVDGDMVLDEGILLIVNNSFEKSKAVNVSGFGVDSDCPTAIIKCAEGDEVIPQTVLHLYGDESYSSSAISKWSWSVDQPPGSQSVFIPSNSFPNPTFETNVAGIYSFHLVVYNDHNIPSCAPAIFEVVVIPDDAIHVELLWHTPQDPDETDTGPETGADLDLHFLHPWAAGPDLDGDGNPDGWFDSYFDCFWFNAHPNWGSFDPDISDDPALDRDDTDGAGPENMNLDIPENVTYRIGVHYWDDHGYGISYATIRVYIYGKLAYERNDVLMITCDMWEAVTVDWPTAKITTITNTDGSLKLIPMYSNPYFFDECGN